MVCLLIIERNFQRGLIGLVRASSNNQMTVVLHVCKRDHRTRFRLPHAQYRNCGFPGLAQGGKASEELSLIDR